MKITCLILIYLLVFSFSFFSYAIRIIYENVKNFAIAIALVVPYENEMHSIIQKTLKAVLDIMDSCDKASISMVVQLILDKFLFYSRDNNNNGVNAATMERRSSIILCQKLNELLQAGRAHMEPEDIHKLLPETVFNCVVKICNAEQMNNRWAYYNYKTYFFLNKLDGIQGMGKW